MEIRIDGEKMRILQKALTPFTQKADPRAPDITSAIHYEVQGDILRAIAMNGYEMAIASCTLLNGIGQMDPVCFDLMPFKVGNAVLECRIDIPTSTVFVYGKASNAYTLTAPEGKFPDWRDFRKKVLEECLKARRTGRDMDDINRPAVFLHPDRIGVISNASKAIGADFVAFWHGGKVWDSIAWKAEGSGITITGVSVPMMVNREVTL